MANRIDKVTAEYAATTVRLIRAALADRKVYIYDLSPSRLTQLAVRLTRDLARIKAAQGDQICLTKVAGYWAFWIRKVKPIVVAYDSAHVGAASRDSSAEIADINEKIALEFAVSYIQDHGRDPSRSFDPFRGDCTETSCDGKVCVRDLAQHTLHTHGNLFSNYVVHAMRFRTFGPHHFVMFLDQLLIASCYARQARASASQAPPP